MTISAFAGLAERLGRDVSPSSEPMKANAVGFDGLPAAAARRLRSNNYNHLISPIGCYRSMH